MLFDTHVHLNVAQFEEDREEVIKRARDAGIEHMSSSALIMRQYRKRSSLPRSMILSMQRLAGTLLMRLI